MRPEAPFLFRRIVTVSFFLAAVLFSAMVLGLGMGSSGLGLKSMFDFFLDRGGADEVLSSIVWGIRFPRVLLAALVGGTLSLGGLVFQALLRNPLAEPYILGVSGGSAVGAIMGIMLGLSRFPGVGLTSFGGGMAALGLILVVAFGRTALERDSLLLAGVMVNAFCSAVIMFLISMAGDSRLHGILFWLMGDLSLSDTGQVLGLSLVLVPCFILIFCLSRPMNLLLMGRETALSMGVRVKMVSLVLLITTSLMVSASVCCSGLLGFVGLVVPHLLRILLGSDHRVLVPACVLGGGAYMVLCDLLARTLPARGEMPVGVVTAMIGAPLFILLLKRSWR